MNDLKNPKMSFQNMYHIKVNNKSPSTSIRAAGTKNGQNSALTTSRLVNTVKTPIDSKNSKNAGSEGPRSNGASSSLAENSVKKFNQKGKKETKTGIKKQQGASAAHSHHLSEQEWDEICSLEVPDEFTDGDSLHSAQESLIGHKSQLSSNMYTINPHHNPKKFIQDLGQDNTSISRTRLSVGFRQLQRCQMHKSEKGIATAKYLAPFRQSSGDGADFGQNRQSYRKIDCESSKEVNSGGDTPSPGSRSLVQALEGGNNSDQNSRTFGSIEGSTHNSSATKSRLLPLDKLHSKKGEEKGVKLNKRTKNIWVPIRGKKRVKKAGNVLEVRNMEVGGLRRRLNRPKELAKLPTTGGAKTGEFVFVKPDYLRTATASINMNMERKLDSLKVASDARNAAKMGGLDF